MLSLISQEPEQFGWCFGVAVTELPGKPFFPLSFSFSFFLRSLCNPLSLSFSHCALGPSGFPLII